MSGALIGHYVFVPLPGQQLESPAPRGIPLEYSGPFPALPMFAPTPYIPAGTSAPLPRFDAARPAAKR